MADDIQRLKQYDYAANSNLVLQSNRSRRRDQDDGTGEVESLSVGKLGGKMGDRVAANKSEELDELMEKRKKRLRSSVQGGDEGLKKGRDGAVARIADDFEDTEGYKPKTKAAKIAYEHILSFMQLIIGDQPRDLIRSAADETIAVFKSERHRDSERKRDVEELLGEKLSADNFSRLSTFAAQITDFGSDDKDNQNVDADNEEQNTVDDLGVAVVFDEELEDEASELDEIVDEEMEPDEGEETRTDLVVSGAVGAGTEVDQDQGQKMEVDPHDVDGYWLQRQLSKYIDDALKSKEAAEEVFSILSEDSNERDRENKLVMMLDYDKFDFIKLILRNRLTIVYCTKFARASPSEKQKLEEELAMSSEGHLLLAKLKNNATDGDVEMTVDGSTSVSAADKSKRAARKSRTEITAPLMARDGAANGFTSTELRKLDLDSLAFSQGSHIMSNKKVNLPKDSFVVNKKDYEEWHIPAVTAKAANEKLVLIRDLPDWARTGFSEKMKALNRMQSQVYDGVFNTDDNVLLCAPTGAGKTNVAMLAVLREIGKSMDHKGKFDLSSFKVIYVAPMKALVAEVVANLGARLEKLGVTVAELTGDVNMTKQEIANTQVIVTTPEKWDIITRKSGERTFTELVKLMIVDEVHLLHDERGPVLESVIARSIRAVEATSMETRIVGLSATLPNYKDVGAFLRVKPERRYHFDSSYRPCPLQQQYLGIQTKKALKRFQLMNELTWEKVKEQATGSGGSQVLVFVHSRKETFNTAKYLRDMAIENNILDDFMTSGSSEVSLAEVMESEADTVKSPELVDLLKAGFAVHHAGLALSDRKLVEELFAEGHTRVLVSTATLAWGVNLPAHAVIIKGTQIYSPEKGRWTELSPLDVMQMMGRAGRPQYDTHGEGIMITTDSELQFYRSLLNQQLPIESQMLSRLPDSLNAEIALGTVSNVKEASIWLGYTYLYVRMVQNPVLYGISIDEQEADPTLEKRRLDLVHSAALILDKAGLVRYDGRSGQLQGTDLGRVASHFYVSHTTMSVFAEHLKPTLGMIDLLRLFSLSGEFQHMRVREEEKLELSRLLERVPVPVKDSIEESTAKVNVLLQAYISNLKLDGLALTSDMVYVTQSAGRIVRAIYEIVLRRKWCQLADRCLNLSKMVQRRQWATQTPLRQFGKVLPSTLSEDVLRKIERKDIEFERYYDLEPEEIGELLRNSKMGRVVHKMVHYLPRMDVQAQIQPVTRSTLRIELILTPDFEYTPRVHGAGEPFWIFVEDSDNETLLHHESFYLRGSVAKEEHTVTFTVPISEPLPPQYFVRCVSDRWISPDTVVPVSFRNLILPERFPPHTELLDMQPLLTKDAFRGTAEDADMENALTVYFSSQFKTFNPIQTQAFNGFYKSQANCMLAAPAGSGRLILAEVAIGQLFVSQPAAAAVYVCSRGEIAVPRKVKELRDGIADSLGLVVSTLTGETTADLRVLATPGVLVVCSPEHWDNISRRWKQRKVINNVSLFIVDDVHYVAGHSGPVVEVICLRMRYIAEQATQSGKKACRLIALSDPVANARDLADWLGVPHQNMFSFHANSRPVPLETHIQTVANTGSSLVTTMARPIYNAIRSYGTGAAPVVVFVASRRLVRATAFELLTSVSAGGGPSRFLHALESDIAPLVENVKTKALRDCLFAGVGYVHEALADGDREIVEKLFVSGAIQVVVGTPGSSWISSAIYGKLVIVAGTAEEESTSALHRSEYPLSEVMHMMGRAGRPKADSSGVCVVLTSPSQREHYRKFLGEPLPVESHIDLVLADQLNAEIVARVIETKQDAVDYMTWTLFYRRLPQNPNYYNMHGTSHHHISDHLSELIESALEDLEQCRCVASEGDLDMALGPLNLGMVAAYYYIKYTTVERFASWILPKTRNRGLLEVLSRAKEFDEVPVRLGDDDALRKIAAHAPIALGSENEVLRYSNPHIKTHLLLQTHFSRMGIAGELKEDREAVVKNSLRLVQAMVDVTSSAGWLKPALAAMELSQMIVQAQWSKDSPLLQLPHIDSNKAEELAKLGIDGIFPLLDMEDDERVKALGLPPRKLADLAEACNQYPSVEMDYKLQQTTVAAGDSVLVKVQVSRDVDEDEDEERDKKRAPLVHAPHFPKQKEEGWWLVIGEAESNTLLSVKRVVFGDSAKTKLEFTAPQGEPRKYNLSLYLMSDSYLGCDLEENFELDVTPVVEEEEPAKAD
uniref:Uncharacterized protein n=1 Tax=Rhodosorus marinus TaxID=101924 RepID=A0A7S2ZN48_9RHOD|mmetsp:Transcript_25611/g.101065  ORF Transcript_25611/g.101065 Transcript_25611/m.101065 type:complete len:2204 (+) Transcript_25611:105-6716(+)|eukprot:CAMPEP_0113960802 /NCGR_PEP_ID=MMETSP0011_2-20120614/4931_1 /TAXON_ID=101924 /ORGANISM="Rhodosorus marinus" /LENGTH=2203 /DNA_ID=CAMNT_0000972323 /DNA_START=34 /DNA_END=6645 /DNA_ORIENTATION=- /assembly_acc=CAM_ASM_000156